MFSDLQAGTGSGAEPTLAGYCLGVAERVSGGGPTRTSTIYKQFPVKGLKRPASAETPRRDFSAARHAKNKLPPLPPLSNSQDLGSSGVLRLLQSHFSKYFFTKKGE